MLEPGDQLPAGFSAAPAMADDLATVAALMADVDRADYGETVFGEEFLRGEWDRPRFDMTTDTLLVRDGGGNAVAFAQAFDEDVPEVVEGLGIVHPDHRGLGLGTALVEAQEARGLWQAGRIGGEVRLRTAVATPDRAGTGLLELRGFQAVRSFFHMETALQSAQDPPSAPPGVDVRPYEPQQDDMILHRVVMDSFRGQWGQHDLSFDQWRDALPGWMDPGLTFLATAEKEVVGCVIGSDLDGDGWVSELAVLPAARGLGIGTFLLRVAFAEFARRGFRRVLLNVDAENEAGAVRVYQRAGMHVRRQWDLYEKAIEP